MKAQISAEMIILLVALLALVALVANNLINAGKTASNAVVTKTNKIADTIQNTCIVDSDCDSGTCVNGTCQ